MKNKDRQNYNIDLLVFVGRRLAPIMLSGIICGSVGFILGGFILGGFILGDLIGASIGFIIGAFFFSVIFRVSHIKQSKHEVLAKGPEMKKITYKIENGLVNFMIDGTPVASFRASNDLEKDAHIRAFFMGLRYNRQDEFDPIADEIE